MICDAHVHMGYYSRKRCVVPFYYSPRRVLGVLNRCGVAEFVVSSTSAQVNGIGIDGIIKEASEMKRLAGDRAHIFFWLSWHLYQEDRKLNWLESGLFDGIKFHEGETPWNKQYSLELHRVIEKANDMNIPVMFHCGNSLGCTPKELSTYAKEHPGVRFDFAHCRMKPEMAYIIKEYENVWTDTAYLSKESFRGIKDYDWCGRIMFGTDLPVWQAFDECSLTRKYQEYTTSLRELGKAEDFCLAFMRYLGRSTCQRPQLDSSILPTVCDCWRKNGSISRVS